MATGGIVIPRRVYNTFLSLVGGPEAARMSGTVYLYIWNRLPRGETSVPVHLESLARAEVNGFNPRFNRISQPDSGVLIVLLAFLKW